MDSQMYDLCIVGAGMIGSAAARHASAERGVKVCLIGPDEPEKRSLDDDRDIYGAHYDEGRIVSTISPDSTWRELSQRSIARFRDIEKESGITFYNECQCLMAGTKDSILVSGTMNTVKSENIKCHLYEGPELQTSFPFLNFHPEDTAVHDLTNAGVISARQFVMAQQIIARRQGCDIIKATVDHVTRIDQSGDLVMKICTDAGNTYFSKRVLLTTGAFTKFRDLLGDEVHPNVTLVPATVAKVEISEDDAQKLGSMPAVVYEGKGNKWNLEFPRTDKDDVKFYMFPPIKYPDGKYYLKLGPLNPVPWQLTGAEDAKRWYCGQHTKTDTGAVEAIGQMIADVVKGISPLSCHGDFCVLLKTVSNRPYIDMIHPQLGLAIGGNGIGARSCDEMGRIAVNMVTKDLWDSSIPRETLKLQFNTSAQQDTA